jgi:hypothetical protein
MSLIQSFPTANLRLNHPRAKKGQHLVNNSIISLLGNFHRLFNHCFKEWQRMYLNVVNGC